MDEVVAGNRVVWERASTKHVREYDELLEEARGEGRLFARERALLAPVLANSPVVVHFQSGHGLDDVALVKAGAKSVVGVDYSSVAAGAAQRRATELQMACRYVVAEVPGVPVRDASVDLVYTGKGALIWMRDIDAWARDAARLLRPGGHLFVYEGHPAVPLWSWDEDEPRIRPDRSYFAESHINDTFPGNGAQEWQWNARPDRHRDHQSRPTPPGPRGVRRTVLATAGRHNRCSVVRPTPQLLRATSPPPGHERPGTRPVRRPAWSLTYSYA